MMKHECDVVKDLLPLYHDAACSDASKRMVEEHLLECEACRSVRTKMEENTFDTSLQQERTDVVGHYAKRIKRKSLLVGLCFAGILAVPVLVCLIVNLATGHALNWFFIVLTALMVFASLTAVPLIAEQKKGLWALGSFTVSVVLLLLSCCLYTHGDWFFVATVPTLFGLSVVFLPYALKRLPLKGFAARHKGLIAMGADTVLLYGIIVAAGLYAGGPQYWHTALWNTTANVLWPWALFLIIRYGKANGLIKAGLCAIVSGIHISLLHDVVYWVETGLVHISLKDANLSAWNSDLLINANAYLIILLAGCGIGAVLVLFGILRSRKLRKKVEN